MSEIFNRYEGGLHPEFNPRQTDDTGAIMKDEHMVQVHDHHNPDVPICLYPKEIKLIYAFLHCVHIRKEKDITTLESDFSIRMGDNTVLEVEYASIRWRKIPLDQIVSYALWGKFDTKLPFEAFFRNITTIEPRLLYKSNKLLEDYLKLNRISDDCEREESVWADEVADAADAWEQAGGRLPEGGKLRWISYGSAGERANDHDYTHGRLKVQDVKDWNLGLDTIFPVSLIQAIATPYFLR